MRRVRVKEVPNLFKNCAVPAGPPVNGLSPDLGEEGFRLLLVNTTASPWAASEIAPN